MKLIAFGMLLASLIFSSCRKNDSSLAELPTQGITKKSKQELKSEFTKAFTNALANSSALRKLIKSEALKQFDKDYDVLYEMIKDDKLENGFTFKTLLTTYFDDKTKLEEIEERLPLLTIFIPKLPQNSFSAESWNSEEEIPEVGLVSDISNDVEMFKPNNEKYILKSSLIPTFPVLVVKECERVVFLNSHRHNKLSGRIFKSSSDKEFQFLDSSFENINDANRFARDIWFSQKVKDSYEIYLNNDGWQRDYIYYGITPSIPSGQFSYDHKETITEFSMNGDPMAAYNKIADQTGDPFINTVVPDVNSGWTGGNFEFKVRVLFNSKNGLGTFYETYFPALPNELFELHYERSAFFYTLQSVSLKKMQPYLQLFKWDLNSYASSIRIDIEEVDQSETIFQSETRSSKFAANFAIEPSTGILKKIGLKFGASLETTNSSTFSKTFTAGNDILGGVIIDFADKVILSKTKRLIGPGFNYQTQEYPTGFFKISAEPIQVQ